MRERGGETERQRERERDRERQREKERGASIVMKLCTTDAGMMMLLAWMSFGGCPLQGGH